MFGLTKSRSLILGVSGMVLTGAMITIANQAKAQRLIAQAPPVPPPAPTVPLPDVVTPLPAAPTAPSQVGLPPVPSSIAPIVTPRPVRAPRRVPIAPVPMPGDILPPIPALPPTPDMRTMPASDAAIQSGIAGTVLLSPICSVTAPIASCQPRPYTGVLKVSSIDRTRIIRVTPDETGAFRVRVIPGQYVIEPDSPDFPIGTRQTVTVVSSVMRQMEFNFQGTLAAPRSVTGGAL